MRGGPFLVLLCCTFGTKDSSVPHTPVRRVFTLDRYVTLPLDFIPWSS